MINISVMGFNIVDLSIIAVVFISGFFAYMRGFSWEMISMFSWIITLVAVWYISWAAGPWIGVLMNSFMGWNLPNFVTIMIAALIIFLSITLLLGPMTSMIMEATKNMRFSFMDRILGFCYGAVRGFFVMVVLFLTYAFFVPHSSHPPELNQARLLPWLEASAEIIRDIFPQINSAAI